MASENERSHPAVARAHNTSRLVPPDPSILTEPVRRTLEEEARRFGAPLNTTTVWAHHPALLAAYKAWSKAMSEAALIPAGLKYLVYVRVASLNGCPF
jgi:alkylhydroperoxidase family enzyme